ncbi:transporter substrate-binding domain-containing protein [Shewanella insulae]|uniref:HD domain-containing phosphohydrolase n=1 Tax=Shewanella insulae TaxID=2681496 RepID=UPI001EFDA30A|nr:HD domain-containing phosphohydrolase [Shewanella insulae]MCG9754325.1 transporter substrate-binding domain-containing protein [Shewanella insulae]
MGQGHRMLGLTLAKPKRLTIRFTVVGIFIIATLFTASVAIGLQYYFSQRLATEASLKLYNQSADSTGSYLNQLDNQAINTTKLVANFEGLYTPMGLSQEAKQVFSQAMRSARFIYAIYLGSPDGDLFELVNLDAHPIVRSQLKASLEDRWVIISIQGKGQERIRAFHYLDADFKQRASRMEPTDYDASIRPWFIDARPDKVFKTEPYLFQNLQAPGITYSIRLPNSDAVLAVDVALSSLDDYLAQLGRGDAQEGREVYVYRASGALVASNHQQVNQAELPTPEPLSLTPEEQALVANTPPLIASNETDWPPIDFAVAGLPMGYSIDVLNLVAEMTGLTINYNNGFTWPEFVDKFRSREINLLHSVLNSEANQSLGVFSRPFLSMPFAAVTGPGEAPIKHVAQLAGKRVAIPRGWSIIPIIRQHFPEVEVVEVSSTRGILQAVKDGRAFAAIDNSIVLHYTARQYFIDDLQFHEDLDYAPIDIHAGLSIVMHPENADLIALIDKAIAHISPEQIKALRNKWFAEGQQVAPANVQGTVPYKALIDIAADPTRQKQLVAISLNGEPSFVYVSPLGSSAAEQEYFAILVPQEMLLASSLDKVKKSIAITGLCLLLALPFSWLFASPIISPIKLLALENLKVKFRRYDEVTRVDSYIKEIDELAISLVDMSESIRQHEQDHKALMDAFIKLIAQAIDDKSPYTAGHCNRVPELGLMLAEYAAQSDLPAFEAFRFKDADEHREFRIAAWLHDCGKITTPEHIVDKGSKLELIYNRIHEVRMRFEVLWRDAEIHSLKQCQEHPEREAEYKEELRRRHEQLTEDFAFIAGANVGGEFMEQADIDRLKTLSAITWQRHFDDRLGLSPVEELNYPEFTSDVSLPVTEQLLADKPQHVIARHRPEVFDPKFGIKMNVPEALYNQGEIYNLSISRGTLTDEDRFKINQHITSTIKMLENLPFPPELARVPRYASTHHETLKGTGYPRKLTGEDLSIPERILVLADIFEALTAADRPYKKAKPLSVAIDILHKMVLDQHVDGEVFKLFLSSGIYLEYAERYLAPQQIDEVDIDKYLAA